VTYEPLHHKYRPQIFADLIGQDAIATTLSNAIRSRRIAPAYLFTGPRGTGKTSSARILAKSLNCLQSQEPTAHPCGVCEVCRAIARGTALDVIEIDAASNTGVDHIRDLIERAQFAPVQCRYKVYCLDEVHMLSTAAFNALLKTLEEPPDRVVFILATTDPQRVLPTIISRCQRFDFRRIPLEAMVQHLSAIAAQERINITEEAVQLVAQIAQGGLRDAESLLDQLSLLECEISVERVWDLIGAVPEQDLLVLFMAIAANNPEEILDQARHLMDRGREPLVVLQNLASFYRDLLIAKTAPDRGDLVAITPTTWNQLCKFAHQIEIATILLGQQHLRACEIQVKNTTQPRLWLEVALLGLLPAARAPQVTQTWEVSLAKTASSASASVTSKSPTPQSAKIPPPLVEDAAKEDKPPEIAPLSLQKAPEPPPPVTEPVFPEASLGQPSEVLEKPSIKPEKIQVDSTRVTLPEDLKSSGTASSPPAVPEYPSELVHQQVELKQIWQKVLEQLHPPGTQALLRQQAHLLAFKGREARVGIKSQPLFKMAQERLPNIEAAFQAVFNHAVKVKLEVAAFPADPATAPANGQQVANGDLTDNLSVNSNVNSANLSASNFSRNSASINVATARITPEATLSGGPGSAEKFQSLADSEALFSSVPQGSSWKEVDEVTGAARSFAQFFNGAIVNLETDLLLNSDSKASPVEIDPPSEPLLAIGKSLTVPEDANFYDVDEDEEEGEDELPF
jgi:DNA polymerase-3 subunit gamma/tau